MSDRCEPPPEGFEMVGCYVQNSAPPDLIARLEAATGPAFVLDEAIAGWVWINTTEARPDIPRHYTASIDAALTLVPEGSYWNILTEGDGDGFLAAVVTRQGADAGEPLSWMKAPTPALALCIAALRARSQP